MAVALDNDLFEVILEVRRSDPLGIRAHSRTVVELAYAEQDERDAWSSAAAVIRGAGPTGDPRQHSLPSPEFQQ